MPFYAVKIMVGDFNAKVGREAVYRPTIEKESLHERSNGNGLSVINFANEKESNCGKYIFSTEKYP